MTSEIPINLAYTKLGHGPKPLLAFHGIGQTGLSCYGNFAATLSDQYTVYIFDLPFHGASENFPVEKISKLYWKQFLSAFLENEKILRFDIVGFSIGGRFALATLEAFADRIDQVYLIAPDGVSEHPIYRLATRFTPVRAVFKWSMQNPAPFFQLIKWLRAANLLNKSLVRFTEHMLNTPKKRTQVFRSWVGFSLLTFDIRRLYSMVIKNNLHIWLFTGKYDRLLNAKKVIKLSRFLPENQKIVLKSGHTHLVNQTGAWISSLME